MNTNLNLPNYIIVLGTTYSGCTAVYDYFNGRGDLYAPLIGEEYLLPQLPFGLMSLEASAGNAFNSSSAEFALSKFEDIVEKLTRPKTFWCNGKGYGKKLPLFEKSVRKFLKEICIVNYPMQLEWRRLMASIPERILLQIKQRLGLMRVAPQARLLVSKDELIFSAQKMHNEIFQKNSKGRPILLDMANAGWNPIESTKYFSNRKIIIVIRDPRDQFVELKQFKKASSVEGFVVWYEEMQKRLNKFYDPCIMKVQFEEFVNKNEKIVNEFCKHVSLSSSVTSKYHSSLSKKNVGKYQDHLSQRELNIIEEKLSEYFYVE